MLTIGSENILVDNAIILSAAFSIVWYCIGYLAQYCEGGSVWDRELVLRQI